jgi:Prolyl oligopeptidase family
VKHVGAFFVIVFLSAQSLPADGPKDNIPDNVRRIPPPGIMLSSKERQELANGVEVLGKQIKSLRTVLQKKQALLELLPDVEIYYNAVRYALAHDEFFKPAEIDVARNLLKQGHVRANDLRDGKAPWTTATGLVVRGYVSKIDGSVQPYGLVVPSSYRAGSAVKHRLDIWFHGRGETLSEVNFINDRQKSIGRFAPQDTIVLHPYGRYSNANHFAGEVDTFEALEHVKKHYAIDDNRVLVRGFSMGGAACWHFAVHHADKWAAAAPGAGFSETPEFLKVYQNESLQPTWYEKKLWHLYDCNDWAINLVHCPVVAYSGEKDPQKQAADVMAKALAAEGMSLVHIIGPNIKHDYHPAAMKEINRRIDIIAAKGRDPLPRRVRFTTWTLRYNRMHWVSVDGLEEHWERARVDAEITGDNMVRVTTKNVNGLTLSMPAGHSPLDSTGKVKVFLDNQVLDAAPVMSDRSWETHFRKTAGGWGVVPTVDDGLVRKKHGLQGPIDDAFMDSFIMVRPTGKPLNDKVARWSAGEMDHALVHWRQQFRGEARVKNDSDVNEDDIAGSNLVVWGDPSSNAVLAKVAAKLPIKWDKKSVRVGAKTYAVENHVPVLIFPNPLNPKRYVVLNSGFTYREYDYLNNARQVPKLPDYAVLDVDSPPTSQYPARIVDAGFFNERWELPKK